MSTLGDTFRKGVALLHVVANPVVEAKILLMMATGLSDVEILRSPDREIGAAQEKRFFRLVGRRLNGMPLAYITGKKEFWSLPFKIVPGVLIPRPETELIVETVLALSPGPGETIVDIGTGSGAISVALSKELAAGLITATDVSEKALAVAEENAASNGVWERLRFLRGDLFSPLKNGEQFHLILTNPPYISREEWSGLMPEVRDFEPFLALDGGRDGVDFYRRALLQVSEFLFPGGWFLGEIGAGQDRKILEIAEQNPALGEFSFVPDLSGIKRVFKARKRTT